MSYVVSASKIKLHIHSIPKIKKDGEPEKPKVKNYTKSRRREPVLWTEEEVQYLEKGIAEIGVGKWSAILNKYRDRFQKERTPPDLSDKYRLMCGKGSYGRSPKISFVEVDDNGEVIRNALGECRVYHERFPHSAASRAGRLKLSRDVKEVRVSVQGKKNGILTRHKYLVREGEKRIQVKKLFSIVVEEVPSVGTDNPTS